MAKRLKAKVNGVEVQDGEIVTLIVQVRARVQEIKRYDGGTYTDVDFVVGDSDSWVDAFDAKHNGKFTVANAAILRTKP